MAWCSAVVEPAVIACVAPADLYFEADPLSGQVAVDWRRCDLTAPDQAALELALQAGEAWGVRVLVVAAGPVEIDEVLRQALALGASALRVAWTDDGWSDGAELARALAAAIQAHAEPLLVWCGDRSPLRGTGEVPAFLAAELGLAQALGLVSVAFEPGERSVLVERRLDSGWRERLRVSAPAVCSVEAAGVRLRRAPLASALAASDAIIPVVVPAPSPSGLRTGPPRPYRPRTKVVAAPQGATRDRLLALTGALAAQDPPRLVGPVDPAGAAGELLEYLGRHGYAGGFSDPTP
jgi:electron transfer flavoprotein beta subunit